MSVYVGNNLLEPGPLLNIQKNVIVAGNQTKLGQTYTLSIIGTLCADRGSPNSSGIFWTTSPPAPIENIQQSHKLYSLESKQRSLEALFATNGQWIEWQSPDGSQPLKAQFKNARVTFPEGNWAQICTYNITCECDLLYLNGNPVVDAPFPDFIQNATEGWNIKEGPAIYTFDLQHNVSAVGKSTFDNVGNQTQSAWQNAKDFVNTKLTLGFLGSSTYSPLTGRTIFNQSSLGSGAVNFSSLSAYNYARSEVTDELQGSFGVNEKKLTAPLPSED